jgi:hypothetical protein
MDEQTYGGRPPFSWPKSSDMPTTYKPQLDHIGFNWTKDAEIILQKLMARKDLILAKAGFSGTQGCTYNSATATIQTERSSFLKDIGGALSWAAAVQMDAGFKPANKVIATLRAVRRDPSVINTRNVEPEALGMLASQYRRVDEALGTFGFDLYHDDGTHKPDLQQVERAASRAILLLKMDIKRGSPRKTVLCLLAEKLRDLFLRYNDVAARRSIASDGGVARSEAGPFLEFLRVVIAIFNEFFENLPRSYDAKPISPVQLTVQVARKVGELRSIHRPPRSPLHAPKKAG